VPHLFSPGVHTIYNQPVPVAEKKQQAFMLDSSQVQIWTFTPPQLSPSC